MTNDTKYSLADPASPVFGIASTAIMGALPLIDASTLNTRQRQALHIATAVVSGLYVAITVGGKRPPLQALAGLTGAAIAFRFARVGDVFDAFLEDKLQRAGTRYPRRWMAVGTAALTFAGFLADRSAAGRRGSHLTTDPSCSRTKHVRLESLAPTPAKSWRPEPFSTV